MDILTLDPQIDQITGLVAAASVGIILLGLAIGWVMWAVLGD